jgi:hypothetical protein
MGARTPERRLPLNAISLPITLVEIWRASEGSPSSSFSRHTWEKKVFETV